MSAQPLCANQCTAGVRSPTTPDRDRSRVDSAHSMRQQAAQGYFRGLSCNHTCMRTTEVADPIPRAAGRACHVVVQGTDSSLPTLSSTLFFLNCSRPTGSMAVYGLRIRHHGPQWRGSGTKTRLSDQRYSGLKRVLSWWSSRAALASSRPDVSPRWGRQRQRHVAAASYYSIDSAAAVHNRQLISQQAIHR